MSTAQPAALLLVLTLAAPVAHASALEGDLTAARELYASAAFEEALAALQGIAVADLPPVEAATVHRYRAACLFALGRSTEAEGAMEAIVRATPELNAESFEGSPRLRELFAAVRGRVLPNIVQDLYVNAKAGFTEKAPDAGARFERVLTLLGDPALAGGQASPALSDLKTLVEGFIELNRAAKPAAPEPAAATAPANAAATGAIERTFYTTDDPGVAPPKIIRQDVPQPPVLASRHISFAGSAALEVSITEEGTVESVVITKSINPLYDALLVEAAKRWRYEPAMREGAAVPFRKKIVVNVRDEDEEGNEL